MRIASFLPLVLSRSSFKGLIASGIHVAAIWRLLDHDANGDATGDIIDVNAKRECCECCLCPRQQECAQPTALFYGHQHI